MITVVSGLPRSGTSMMMQMLEAGGLTLYQDGQRNADRWNPKGYFETRRTLDLGRYADWIGEAENQVIKIVSPLLLSLPLDRQYSIIYMRRCLREVCRSQELMSGRSADDGLIVSLGHHLVYIQQWLSRHGGVFKVLWVNYIDALNHPVETAEKISGFLDLSLDSARIGSIPDERLYRVRSHDLGD